MSIFLKILAVLLAWNGTLWLVLGWLLAPVVPGGWGMVAAVAVVLLAPLVMIARGLAGHGYPLAATRVWIYRPFWYGQLFLPLLAGAGLVGIALGFIVGVPQVAGRWALGGMALILAVGAVLGYLGSKRLIVRPLQATFDRLPPELDGLRIVQLSDLHVGPHTPRRHLLRIVDAVRRAEPHLIVLTGDQVDDYPRDVEPLGAALGGLSAPLGVIAVPGNHDVYAGWSAVRRGMEHLGWRVLVNEAIPLEWNGTRFWIAGTGDPAGSSGPMGADPAVAPDIDRSLATVPVEEFTIALAHNPALWPQLAERGVELTLSGHTHYGQLAIPGVNWSIASPFLEHAMGEHRRGGSMLYINPGTNYWGIPFRLGTPPEVTAVTLSRRTADSAPSRRVGAGAGSQVPG